MTVKQYEFHSLSMLGAMYEAGTDMDKEFHCESGTKFVLASDYDALSARCAELEAELAQYRPGAVSSDLSEISGTEGACFTDGQSKPVQAPTHCGCYTWTNGFGDSGSYLCPEHRPGGAAMKGE